MEESRNAVWGVVYEPVLKLCHTVTEKVGSHRLLACILREMSHAIRDEFTALDGVELAVLVKQIVHEAALELCQTLFL